MAGERDEGGEELVQHYRILSFRENPLVPCRGVIAQLDKPIGAIIPVLFISNIGRATYLPQENVLTLRIEGRLVTFYPDGRITLNRAWTEEAARRVLSQVVEMVNEAYRELLAHGPPTEEDIRRALSLSWRDIYSLLPGSNCGLCGQRTCLSLALAVLRGEARLSDCPALSELEPEAVEHAREVLGPRIARALGL